MKFVLKPWHLLAGILAGYANRELQQIIDTEAIWAMARPYGEVISRLVENAREQKIIARMRRMQAEGMSFRGIAVRLDAEGIRPKRGKRWIHTTAKTILARNAA